MDVRRRLFSFNPSSLYLTCVLWFSCVARLTTAVSESVMKSDVKLFVILCVIASLFLVFIYNFFIVSQWKPSDKEQRIHLSGKLPENYSTVYISETFGTKHPRKIAASRTNLIVLSPGRGGSSFLGGIFDSSPQNIYWFEPLWLWREELLKLNVLKTRKGIIQYKENSVNLINSLLKCDFSDIPSALLSRFTDKFFYARSTAFTTLCSHRRCRPFSSTLLNQVCNSYKHTVIKILDHRLPNGTIQSFQELFQRQNGYDVKVIQLVRDPRAVVYSRVYLARWIKWSYRDSHFRLYVYEICDRIEQILRMGLLYPLPWLRDRFKVIRFEDLAVNTSYIAQDLYRFAGFDWSVSVDRFISSHNKSPKQTKKKRVPPYSLYRKASDVIDKWKSAPKDFIKVVEDVCGDLMDILGYDKLLKPH